MQCAVTNSTFGKKPIGKTVRHKCITPTVPNDHPPTPIPMH